MKLNYEEEEGEERRRKGRGINLTFSSPNQEGRISSIFQQSPVRVELETSRWSSPK